jgi:NDP-sugar pyrophosphorylase family protein
LLEKAIRKEQVSGEKHAGCWFDIGTTERLKKLREFTKKD